MPILPILCKYAVDYYKKRKAEKAVNESNPYRINSSGSSRNNNTENTSNIYNIKETSIYREKPFSKLGPVLAQSVTFKSKYIIPQDYKTNQ